MKTMRIILATALASALAATSALAQAQTQRPAQNAPAQSQARPAQGAPAQSRPAAASASASTGSGQGQALLLETAGKWQAFATQGQGRNRVCYALGKAGSRSPANLKDVAGYVFVSSRPAEGVRNEISLVMNFDLKEDVEHQAIVGDQRFALVAKGQNLWLKNPAEEPRLLDAMRRGSELEIKGTSKRGNPTSDKHSLAGLAQTVKRAEDACK